MSTLIRTGGGGADLSVVTAAASDVLASKVIVDSSGNPLTGTIPSKTAATITPGTANQTIAAGQYLTGVQTILGDADLISANIKSGIDIFGVAGTYGLKSATITTSGNWTVPAGVTKLFAFLIGGGGGGGWGNSSGGGAGGGGGYAVLRNLTVTPGQVIAAVVGAGGAVAANGGATSFGTLTISGGKRGANGSSGSPSKGGDGNAGGGAGGYGNAGKAGGSGATGADGVADYYQNIGIGSRVPIAINPITGDIYGSGGGGGGGGTGAQGGAGGPGAGNGGTGGLPAGAGGNATAYGCGGGGGGGANPGGVGGNGYQGLIIVMYYA